MRSAEQGMCRARTRFGVPCARYFTHDGECKPAATGISITVLLKVDSSRSKDSPIRNEVSVEVQGRLTGRADFAAGGFPRQVHRVEVSLPGASAPLWVDPTALKDGEEPFDADNFVWR